MKGGNKLFLFAGVGLAIVAVLLGITMSSSGEKSPKDTVDAQGQEETAPSIVTVVRLIQDIEQHQVIKAEMIETVEIDASLAPSNPVTVAANVVNQSYTLKASTGEILRQEFVAPPGITASIEPGMRAVSIAVDSQGSMSGLVVTGDYVDVVFEARVDLRRMAWVVGGFEIRDDGSYELKSDEDDEDDDDSSNTDDGSNDTSDDQDDSGNEDDDEEDGPNGEAPATTGFLPYEGREGSEFVILDGGDMLEPVSKMLVQDVKVIRVIAPGERYDAQGQAVVAPEDAGPNTEELGQLIIQVTPQQAEAIAFMQNDFHSYSIAVRGKDDHALTQTTGVTFQILMTDGTWSLPWPEAVVAEEARENRATPVASPVAADPDAEPTT